MMITSNELGVQAEIEKEITALQKFWIKDEETNKRKIILYIYDIDRCSETKMTSIIDSLRTVLENAEIRKRLIIICSIDPEKIIKGIEYKYKTLYDDKEERRTIAIDQMDKIFLTGIALSPLNNNQLLEFASKLAKANDEDINNQKLKIRVNQNIMFYGGQEILSDNSISSASKIDEYKKFNDSNIYKLLENIIKDYKKQLTPRKIRIIYYRILLANNIICKMKDPKITKALIQKIFSLSVGEKINNDEASEELSDILNMVVPYKYNEEEDVKDKVGEVAIQS